MAFDCPAPDDPRILVEIVVPVGGGKTMVLAVPRFDYMPEPTLTEIEAAWEKINSDETLNGRQRNRATVLALLKPFVSEQDYMRCEALPGGPLAAIETYLGEQSRITLSEYLASDPSSPVSSEAPQNTTLSAPDTTDATLETG